MHHLLINVLILFVVEFESVLKKTFEISGLPGNKIIDFFTARCYASAVLALALCFPSVRHKSEFY